MGLIQKEDVCPANKEVVRAPSFGVTPFIGESSWCAHVRSRLPIWSRNSSLVALIGDTGAGKSLLARHIHVHSSRGSSELVDIDLRKINANTVLPFLFGKVESTGPGELRVLPGMVAAIGTGTCLLQGLECQPASIQEQCLEWLTTGKFSPVGASEQVHSASRLILEIHARELHRGRSATLISPILDLLQSRVIAVEPLSCRREDILPIATYYLKRTANEWGMRVPQISPAAKNLLVNASWQNNVHGLIKVVMESLGNDPGEQICPSHLPAVLAGRLEAVVDLALESTSLEEIVSHKLQDFFNRLGNYEVNDLFATVISKVERPLFSLVLNRAKGNQVKAARWLGMNRNTLRSRIKRYKLSVGGKK